VEDILDAAPDGTVIVSPDGTIVYANRRIGAMFGIDEREVIGQSVEVLVPAAVRERHVEHRTRYDHNPHGRPMGAGLELFAMRHDGTTFPVEISLAPLAGPSGQHVIASVRDVTDRTAAEAEIQAINMSLVRAEERARIAQDLHDSVIQRIFAAGLSLQSGVHLSQELMRDRVLHVVDDLDATIRELRESIFELNSKRRGTDLATEILSVINETTASVQNEPEVHLAGIDHPVGERVLRELLPTLREALTNAVRHAKANTITVDLRIADTVRLRVADDGVGIAQAQTPGRGLVNLRARAMRLGGSCLVQSVTGRGTELVWEVPNHE
jgi:PAS domain S-box-containing protein